VKRLKKVLPLVGILFLPTLFGYEVEFNYKPVKNNLNTLTPKELEAVLPQIEDIKSFKCSKKRCYIELKPLLVDISFKGFSIFSLPRLEEYLGLRPYYRYSEKRLLSVSGNIVSYLKNNGYISPTVKTRLFIDRKGYARLQIIGNEGELYLLGGFLFQSDKKCFSEKEFLWRFKKPLGIPFSTLDLYHSLEIAEKLCKEKYPYYTVYTFYSEPFEVKREPITRFLMKNFKINPFKVVDFLTYYADVLITNPYKGIKFLFHPTETVYPKVIVYLQGENLKISIEGNKFFSKAQLKKEIEKLIHEEGFLSLEGILNFLRKKYRDSGFLDVKISIIRKRNSVKILIKEGRRYKVFFETKPHIDFKFPNGKYYSKKLIESLRHKLEEFLKREGFYFKKLEPVEVVDREKKTVKVVFFIEDLKPLKVKKEVEISVPDRGLKEKIKEILQKVDVVKLVFNPSEGKKLGEEIKKLLEDYGCVKPVSEFELEEHKKFFMVKFKVSCAGKAKFGKTAYWIEGRIPKREIEYMVLPLNGKRFNKKLLELLRTRFEKTQLFESLSVIPVKVDGKVIPLVWGRERKPFSTEGWFGYNSDEGLSGSFGLKIFDLLKFGETISTSIGISQKRTVYSFDYFDNYLFSRKVFGGFGVFKKWEEHRDYSLTTKGLSLTYGWHFNWWTDLSLNFLKGDYQLDDGFTGGDISKITLSAEINYPIYSGGVKKGLFNGYVHYGISLNKANYSKLRVGGVLSLLWRSFYLSLKGSFGYVTPKAPVFEKFYLGGLKNLKGYGYESVGPYGGGDLYWYTGIEAGVPAFKSLYLFGGFDFGNAVKRSENPFKDFKKDIFVGAGTVTTMGPVRFVLATPLEGKFSLTNLKTLVLIGFSF
jgi:outer membrane protein insertion porin family